MSAVRPLLVAAALFTSALPALAQPASVTVEPRLSASTAAPGDSIEVIFKVELSKTWHLYSPDSKEGLPTSVKLEPDVPGISAGAFVPRGEVHELEIEGVGKARILEGTFELVWRLQVAKDAALGARQIAGTITYQVCDDKTCEMPKSVPFSLALEVAPPTVKVGPTIELPESGPVIANITGATKVAAGARGEVELDLFVRPHFHIYAPGSEGERVTKLELDLPPGFTAGELVTPPPTKSETDDLGKANLWEGKVKLSRGFTAPAGAQGTFTIKARARWLVCDAKTCQPGRETKELTIEVVPASGVAPTDSATSTNAPQHGTLALIVTSIWLGLINILMPCTLPMIPITISLFSKGKKLSKGQSVFRASVYAAGIVTSFALMGGLIQAIFGNKGQGVVLSIATNGPLNLAIGGLFVYFALSFFGYYEIELPEFLRAFVEKSVDKAKSTAAPGEVGVPLPALFLMGFFFVLTSYTCGAPLVLGVLTAGLATPTPGSVILATAVFGATTAAPFFVLALVPGALKSLPRSGGWFKTFKVALGVIEIAAALKFFSNADLYWRAGILTREVFLAIWVACGVFMTLYVAHAIKFAHDDEATEPAPKFQPKAWLRAVPFLLLTVYVADALRGITIPPRGPGIALVVRHEIAANLAAFLPPEPYPGSTSKSVGSAKHGFHLPRTASYEKAREAALRSKRPLFIEFTGDA
ncbi:MAG: protein-disulfide reductase DsbD domain-containing protein [Planctomycetota bacterium]